MTNGYVPLVVNTSRSFPSFTTYYRVCNQINTTSATTGAGLAHPSGAHEFTPGFYWGSCYSIFSFICMFFRSLFVLLYFLFGHCVVILLRYTDSDCPKKYRLLLDQTILLHFRSSIDRPLSLPQYPGSNNYISIREENI